MTEDTLKRSRHAVSLGREGLCKFEVLKPTRKSNFALRVQPSLLEEARKVAETEGVVLNQLINVALAEKLSALRTESYFVERGARADPAKALEVLTRAGRNQPPVRGDDLI